MKVKDICLTILLTCFIISMFFAKAASAMKNGCGKEMSAAEMAERALDIQKIQNVMGYHQLYGSPGGDHDKEIELIWAQKTPDVSFAGNGYIYRGTIDVVKNTYGSGGGGDMMDSQSGPGNTSFRTLTTPIIEVAGDGKTAKAFWYTIGWNANIRDGKGSADWSYEKYGIDFVKEDGEWKIWHFHVYNDWDLPMGKDLAQYAVEKSKEQKDSQQQSKPVYFEKMSKYYTAKTFNESYSTTRKPNPLNPRPPVAYCRFEDTFSYADE